MVLLFKHLSLGGELHLEILQVICQFINASILLVDNVIKLRLYPFFKLLQVFFMTSL